MSKTQRTQQLLNWLNNEKNKDKVTLVNSKKKMIEEIKKLKKEDLIKLPPKMSLWKKIKIMILGH